MLSLDSLTIIKLIDLLFLGRPCQHLTALTSTPASDHHMQQCRVFCPQCSRLFIYSCERPELRSQLCVQAAKTPHHDMSALEVESSVRYCEHLLFVQRSQRHTLSTLSQQFKQLQALVQVLTSFKHGSLAPQVSIITSTCSAHDYILLNTQYPSPKVSASQFI